MNHRVPLTEETACNLCGSSDYEVVSVRDRDGAPLRTTMCRRCGLVWTNPRPSVEALDEYYRQHYRSDYKGMRRPTTRKLVRGLLGAMDRRQRLLPALRPGARVLDIGAGAGELVYVLRASGFDARGLEPDQEFAQFAGDVLGVPIDATPVAQATFPPESFDAITMFHVLEHVADPVGYLSRVLDWLNRSGILLVEVPNVESTGQAPQHRFHFAHLFSFSPGTLEDVGRRAGFTPLSTEVTSDGGNIVAVFRKRYAGTAGASAQPITNHYAATAAVLRRHSVVRHYLSRTPYLRVVARLRHRLREDRLLRQLKTERNVLRWAKEGGVETGW